MMLRPLLIMDVLTGLNLGQQMMVVAVLSIAVFYLFRAKKAGGVAVGLMSTAWLITVSVGAVFALVVFFNWADPNIGKVVSDVTMAFNAAAHFVTNYVIDFVQGLLGR